MYQLLVAIICAVFINACSNAPSSIDIGSVSYFYPLHGPLPKKPTKEIARVCRTHSLFSDNRLTINDLLLKAYRLRGSYIFHHVGLWYKNINILYLWERECLILGDI